MPWPPISASPPWGSGSQNRWLPASIPRSRRRVLVSDWVDGRPFSEMVKLPEPERDRIGQVIYRFYYGSMHVLRRYNSDPHPGNYLLAADGRIAFLDFGSVKTVDADWIAAGTEVVAAAMD